MFDLSRSHTPEKRIFAQRQTSKAKVRPSAPLKIAAYAEVDGVGLGRLSDGSAYLSQRGLAHLAGVQNAHIGTISRDWDQDKPRILAIKAHMAKATREAHTVLLWAGRRQYCYSPAVCEAVLDYYALDAGDHIQAEAQTNRIRFKREDLGNWILSQVAPQPPKADKAARPEPLRFMPLSQPQAEARDELMTAFIAYVCGLCALSVWMANAYLEGLKQRAMNAPWNRLGLYLPLKAILEIQAEAVLLMKGTFTVR